MLWVLPINLPVLVVWIRNLALHWLTPFSSHHNIMSILPFILLVETGATGRMVPRLQSNLRYVTIASLYVLAAYAAVYSVSYAYGLHQWANAFCGWLVLVLWFSGSWELGQLEKALAGKDDETEESRNKKRP
jgi:glycosylphosphatidylinositol deacylase